MTDAEKARRFADAKRKIIGEEDGLTVNDRERPTIGTLSEKTVHAVLKNYLEPDEDRQEIPIGSFVADIYRPVPGTETRKKTKKELPHEILEIQTRAMYRMGRKLEAFLPLYPVTIVYPIPHKKQLYWVDEETGELSSGRRSPKTGTFYDAVRELYSIREYLTHPNLRICLILLDVREYKLLNGYGQKKKIRATRYDRIPENLAGELFLSCPEDYMQLLPADLPEEFTSGDLAKSAKLSREAATLTLALLRHVGVIEQLGKKGRAYLYRCRY